MDPENLAMDPEVRHAVLKLFHANEKFRQAYSEWMKATDDNADRRLQRVDEAERSVDRARLEAAAAQRRALGFEKTFEPRLP